MDEDLTINELLEKYPYLQFTQKSTILLTEKDYKAYNASAKIKYNYTSSISIELLKDLILKDEFYDYVTRLLEGKLETIRICYIAQGDTLGRIELNKSEIAKALVKVFNKDTLSEEIKTRLGFFENQVSFQKFQEDYASKLFNITIEDKMYTFKIEDFITFLTLDTWEFVHVCLNEDIKVLKGVDKKYFMYALSKFFSPLILDSYLFPEEFLKHLQDIKNYTLIDFQAVNKILKTKDPNIAKFTINPDLHAAVLIDLPQEYSLLEKAIYIYIKMCKILTYDEEFYASKQSAELTKIHDDIARLSQISPKQNKVVCYEFNALYGKFLAELGINFETDQVFQEKFGGGHANLVFRVGQFLVLADSVTSILKGDIAEAKFNFPLHGLVCQNKNAKTKGEFKKMLNQVYENIALKEKSIEEFPMPEPSFAEVIAEYRSKQKIEEIPFAERFDIFFQKLQAIKKEGIDHLSYLLHLEKILFTIDELDDIIDIKIIGNKETNQIRASVIITVNPKGIKEYPRDNIYYLYNPNEEKITMTSKEIFARLSNNTFNYLGDGVIPGLGGFYK